MLFGSKEVQIMENNQFKCSYCHQVKDNDQKSNKIHGGRVCKLCKKLFLVLNVNQLGR